MARHQQSGRRGGAGQAAGSSRTSARSEQRSFRRSGREENDFGGAPHLGAMGDPAEGKTSAAEDER
jgi:hypothetical protein